LYVGQTVGGAVLFTWVFNHARGSILLVTLMHASTNAAGGTFPGAFFPALFPQPLIPTSFEIGIILLAALVAVTTRGRLGYDRYSRGAESSASSRD
jgi:CAAX protease family protein